MQEQAAIDLKEMVASALDDPLITGKEKPKKKKQSGNNLLKQKKNIDYAINKMTEEVWIIESRIERATQILNDIQSIAKAMV